MHEIMHLNTRRPSGMTRMMGREVEGLQSASVWIGLWHQQLKKNMTPCLLLHLIHSVPNSVSSHSNFIASPVLWIPFLGSQFSLTFMTLFTGHKTIPSRWNPKELLELALSPASCLLSPPHAPSVNGNQPPPSQFNILGACCLPQLLSTAAGSLDVKLLALNFLDKNALRENIVHID